MKLSIVIPAFNEEKLLGRCLESVLVAVAAVHARGWQDEVIVCDNNSTDRTAALARAAGATVVFEPVNQIARARNRGAAVATGDWLLFLDADSTVSRELFDDLAGTIASGGCVAGGATVRMADYAGRALWLVRFWNGLSRFARWAPGGFFFCDARVFQAVGGFSQELFVSEELDLSRRLKRAARAQGKRIVILHRHPFVTSARKIHLYSAAELRRFFFRYLWSPFRTQRDRTACDVWYDGRR